jgi:hypothetical protein
MRFYTLENSHRILIKNGEVDNSVLVDLIKEAYSIEGLNEEDWIHLKKQGGGRISINYKELYDCYLSLDKKRKFHYSDKPSNVNLAREFILEQDRKSFVNYLKSLSNVSIGDVVVRRRMNVKKKKKQKKLSSAA